MRAPWIASGLLVGMLLGCGYDDLDPARLEGKADDDDMAAVQQTDVEALAAVCQSVAGLLTWQEGAFRCVLPTADAATELPDEELAEQEVAQADAAQVDAGASPTGATDASAATDAAVEDASTMTKDGGSCPPPWAWLCNGIQAGSQNGNSNGNGNGSGNDVTIVGVQISL